MNKLWLPIASRDLNEPIGSRQLHREKCKRGWANDELSRSLSKIAQSSDAPSHQITRHPLYGRHVVVQDRLFAAIVPFDGHARPIFFGDGALIGLIVLPANTITDVEGSGLVAGHWKPCPAAASGVLKTCTWRYFDLH